MQTDTLRNCLSLFGGPEKTATWLKENFHIIGGVSKPTLHRWRDNGLPIERGASKRSAELTLATLQAFIAEPVIAAPKTLLALPLLLMYEQPEWPWWKPNYPEGFRIKQLHSDLTGQEALAGLAANRSQAVDIVAASADLPVPRECVQLCQYAVSPVYAVTLNEQLRYDQGPDLHIAAPANSAIVDLVRARIKAVYGCRSKGKQITTADAKQAAIMLGQKKVDVVVGWDTFIQAVRKSLDSMNLASSTSAQSIDFGALRFALYVRAKPSNPWAITRFISALSTAIQAVNENKHCKHLHSAVSQKYSGFGSLDSVRLSLQQTHFGLGELDPTATISMLQDSALRIANDLLDCANKTDKER